MKKYVIILLLLSINCIAAFAQDGITVSGTVKDANSDEALIGVTVQVANSTTGTTSDFDGNYSITIPSQRATLIFSYMGYKTKEVNVSKSGTVDVSLVQDAFILDEVVAIGYGTMKKSDLTGSVSSISGEKLKIAPVSGIDQALQGRIAGVTVNANSGQPGAAATVRIRGIGTVNDANPLYVVDGVMLDNIDFLSTSDIESTEVLKDASATAIYGSRGANGVIIVTTKKGNTDGKANISYEMYVGWQSRWKKLDLMGRDDFARIKSIFNGTEDQLQPYFENGDKYAFNQWIQNNFTGRRSQYFPQVMLESNPNGYDRSSIDTDWQDEVFQKNAFMQNHYVSVDGGNKTTTYAFSANFFEQDGIIMGSDFKRLTLRANTSHKVNSWLKIGENLSFSSNDGREVLNNNANSSMLSSAMAMAPWDPTHYPQGAVSYVTSDYPTGKDLSNQIAASSNFKNIVNPFSMIASSYPTNKWERWVGDIYLEVEPIKDLILRGDVSMDLNNGTTSTSYFKHDYSTEDRSTTNGYSASTSKYKNITYELTANYSKKIDKHNFNVMLGTTREDYYYHTLSGGGRPLDTLSPENWTLGGLMTTDPNDPDYKLQIGERFDESRRISFLGRLHYVYNDKYLATFSFRRDGSSKFPKDRKWGSFPSLALAWRVSEEPFFQPLKGKIDMLKLRGGWGRIGNDKVGNNTFVPEMMISTVVVAYPFGKDQQLMQGAMMNNYPGPGKWETTEQWNIGIDASSANGKWYGNLDFFLKDTKDMLMTAQNPAHVGYRFPITANVGEVRNQGIELMLEYRDKISDFNYSISANAALIKNELTHLNYGSKLQYEDGRVISDEGYSLFTFWGYKYDGVFKSQEEIDAYVNANGEKIQPNAKPGDARFRDVDGDGVFDLEKDKTDLGSAFPWLTYGFNLSFDYKRFDLQLFFQGVHGNKIFNASRERLEGYGDESTLSTDMNDVWSESNPNGSIPLPAPLGNSVNSDPSSRFIESGSYLRLKNIQLGYNIPPQVLSTLRIQSLRLYVAASNLFTITSYKGYDPEVGVRGVDYGNYPQARTFMLGAKINF